MHPIVATVSRNSLTVSTCLYVLVNSLLYILFYIVLYRRIFVCFKPLNLRKERKYSAPGSPLTRLNWWRLCLDEAQAVEMPGRLVSEMARKITAVHRWAVTGTPISKNISGDYKVFRGRNARNIS